MRESQEVTNWTGPPCPVNNAAETQGLPALREAVAAVHYSRIRADQLVIAAPQELVLLTMQASLVLAGLGSCLQRLQSAHTGQPSFRTAREDIDCIRAGPAGSGGQSGLHYAGLPVAVRGSKQPGMPGGAVAAAQASAG